MQVIVLGSHGFPMGSEEDPRVLAAVQDTEPQLLQAVADDLERNLVAFGPIGAIACSESGDSIDFELDPENPYGDLADAVHHGIAHSIQDSVRRLSGVELPGLSQATSRDVIDQAANRVYTKTIPGVYITARLLQVIPSVFETQFPGEPQVPVRLGRIARNSVVLGSLLAARDKIGGSALVDLLALDPSLSVNEEDFLFDPDAFEIVALSGGKYEVLQADLTDEDLKLGRPDKDDHSTTRSECPALHVRAAGSQTNLLKTYWDAMSSIVERHHYQPENLAGSFPGLDIGRLTLLAARRRGPYEAWPRK